jgi:hypothetical protein
MKTTPQPLEWVSMNCECCSAQHTIRFCFDPDEGDLYVDVQLTTWHGFFRRCWIAALYVFGRDNANSHWDSTILNDHASKIIELCERLICARAEK